MARLIPGLLGAAALALASCSPRTRDYGTGLNTVERTYPKSVRETWDAALAAVRDFGLTIESDRHDEMGGELKARRADGREVLVHVRAAGGGSTAVAVRVEPGDRTLAGMIHERIAKALGTAGQTLLPRRPSGPEF